MIVMSKQVVPPPFSHAANECTSCHFICRRSVTPAPPSLLSHLLPGFPLPLPSADDAPWTLLGGKAGENASLALHLICAPQREYAILGPSVHPHSATW